MAIATFPKFSGIGRTSSLLDEELLLLGDDDLGTRGRYISIQKPRDGLLAMKYTVEDLPLTQLPHQHSSLVSRNTLTVLGGKFKSRGQLSKFTWTDLSLKWENGSKFTTAFTDSCSVKLGVDVHIIFGGERKVNGEKIGGRQVVKINTTNQLATELQPLTHGRVSHDCQLLNKSIVLVSGGLAQKGGDPLDVLPDELYNITSQKVVKVLDSEHSLQRIQHAMTKIEDRIWALGGRDSNNNIPSKIAEFNPTTNSWEEIAQELHSTNTSELVVTEFPTSAIDCVPECSCGNANRNERIYGGSVAEVRNLFVNLLSPFFQANAYPWIAALLRDEDLEADYINSKCSTVIVSTPSKISSNLSSFINCFHCFYEILLFFLVHSDWEQICPDSGPLPVRR